VENDDTVCSIFDVHSHAACHSKTVHAASIGDKALAASSGNRKQPLPYLSSHCSGQPQERSTSKVLDLNRLHAGYPTRSSTAVKGVLGFVQLNPTYEANDSDQSFSQPTGWLDFCPQNSSLTLFSPSASLRHGLSR
jgi:hypothetical protein